MADASELDLAVEMKFVDSARRTPEELVAKAIAPVKFEYLRPPPLRRCPNDRDSDCGAKKSKRQLKRERLQVRHLCPEIAKTGNVSSCPYSNKCRFSHDLDAFKAEKSADLEGICPFMNLEAKCPYGLACRFENTHRVDSEAPSVQKGPCELNVLKKDVQRLLWKFNMKFPKADAKLKLLGLMHNKGKPNSKPQILEEKEADQIASNGSHPVVENNNAKAHNSVNYIESSTEVVVQKTCTGEAADSDNYVESPEKVPFVETCSGVAANSVNNEVSYPRVLDDENDSSEPSNLDNYVMASSKLVEADHGNGVFIADDLRPPKRARPIVDEKCFSDKINNTLLLSMGCRDLNAQEIEIEENYKNIGSESNADSFSSETDLSLKPHQREKKIIDFRGKLYLAPLTTVGNLPFRRICKVLGADVTCGEMAMCSNLLQGQASEWSLLRRHSSEDLFGVQICTPYPDIAARTVELIDQECTIDFIDVNMGCPIDLVVNKGAGSSLLSKPMRMQNIIKAASATVDIPITVKVRTGFFEGRNRINSIITDIGQWGASALTIHGRSRQQRYSKVADWDYIYECTRKSPKELQVLGNGDIFSYSDWNNHMSDCPHLSSCMIARGALIKPWLFTEIKEQRDWDISSGERFDILKDFVRYSLLHWGSDTKGVETSRHFLLEWLSYTHRYIPVGLLDVIPQRLNWRPPSYFGRNELETLMASDSAADWVRISEMLLGKVPPGFIFSPKHKSNAYDKAENG